MMLSSEQFDAVTRTGQDVCVVAGPGSGKTRVLVRRFRWLVDQAISPLRILAITFTEKAATEIKQRLIDTFKDSPNRQREIEQAYVSTVHGFCARLLRENAIAAGLNPQFGILDERTSAVELDAATMDALDQLFRDRPEEVRRLLKGWAASNPVRALQGVYHAVRATGQSVEQLREMPRADLYGPVQALLEAVRQLIADSYDVRTDTQKRKVEEAREWLRRAEQLQEGPPMEANFDALREFPVDLRGTKEGHPFRAHVPVIKETLIPAVRRALLTEYYAPERGLIAEALRLLHRFYQERKQRLDGLDFDDLQERAIRLLEQNETVRATVQESFAAILMDELQDTNPLQWKLMDLVRRPGNFFGVGDANQSIYGFRHADPKVFFDYRESLSAAGQTVDELRDNYRSRSQILDAVQGILRIAPGIEPHTMRPAGQFQELEEPPVEVIAALSPEMEEAEAIEASWVARRIRELQGAMQVRCGETQRPLEFDDVAILVRNANSLGAIERALQEFQVPYVMSRGKSFFGEAEITDLHNWLRMLADGRDEISTFAVLRSPLVGVSDETILRLRMARDCFADAWAEWERVDRSGFNEDDAALLTAFVQRVRAQRQKMDDVLPDQLLAEIIDECDYESGLSSQARANIDKFLGIVRGLAAGEGRTVAEVVAELDRFRAAENEPNAPPIDSRSAVRVLTMHSAKGLEFPVVFLAALHKGIPVTDPPLTFSPKAGLGAKWRVPKADKPEGDIAQLQYVQDTRKREELEADRLFYVAMTRAEERLVFSFADKGREMQWPEQVKSALGIDIAGPLPQPVILPTPLGFPVRLIAAGDVAENPFPPPAGGTVPEPELLSTLPTGPQHQDTVSLDDLQQFALCPRRYYLQNYIGWNSDKPLLWGADEEMGEPELPEEADWRDVMPGAFFETEVADRMVNAGRVEQHVHFLLPWRDVLLAGRIDLWFDEGGERVLVGVVKEPQEVRHADERRAWESRLQAQALVLERAWGGAPERAYLFVERTGEVWEVTVDAARAEREIAELLRAQGALDFPVQIGEHCLECPYHRGACPVELPEFAQVALGE